MKRIVMMVVAGCAIGILTGCGVPQEEHDAKIAELNTAWAELETLKSTVADAESLLNAEKAKVRNTQIELDNAARRITELTAKETATAIALAEEKTKVSELESAVASAKSATGMAQDRTSEAEAALAALQEEYQKLQSRFDQFEKNMKSIGSTPAPSSAPKAAGAAKSDSETALDLLNEMGMQ